ncbi:hypothetical protein C8F04DRAFT_1258287 [Mycena alexandri]|uniref:Uncharacterized protein n=1 Tax=Mycena alexandri TaxID=1745969 RepID=A0AAD6SY33_9AGAR|nr:hypothetical protein C8F04DRAFT_1258287 [Mycena alexandri]
MKYLPNNDRSEIALRLQARSLSPIYTPPGLILFPSMAYYQLYRKDDAWMQYLCESGSAAALAFSPD